MRQAKHIRGRRHIGEGQRPPANPQREKLGKPPPADRRMMGSSKDRRKRSDAWGKRSARTSGQGGPHEKKGGASIQLEIFVMGEDRL